MAKHTGRTENNSRYPMYISPNNPLLLILRLVPFLTGKVSLNPFGFLPFKLLSTLKKGKSIYIVDTRFVRDSPCPCIGYNEKKPGKTRD